ncbi:TPA: hypothetical protein ENS27_08915 [bacterium]|nr:hypothetical protein [bacterium]
MPDTVVSIPIDVWKKAKHKEDLQAWLLSMQPELETEFQDQEESLHYELSYLDCPKHRIPILLEFSDEEDDTEVISLVPQKGLFASGESKEEAKLNLLNSMQEDYLRLRKQRDSLGKQLLLKLEFLESLF